MIESIEGVALEQYAGVVAALADEVALEEVLANEQIEPTAWPPIDVAWKVAIAGGSVEGPLFKAFSEKRDEAEDWLARPVKPLEDDLAAWMGFLAAYGKHAAPCELLASAGLRLPDLGRLQRRWARRFAEDRELAKRAAEIAKAPPAAPPKVSVGKLVLKPFPWSPGPGAAAPPPDAVQGGSPSAEEMEIPLDRYAALVVELGEPKADRARVMERYGLAPERFAAVDAAWKARIAVDPETERDFRRLHAYQRSRLAAAAKFVPRDPNAPPPALTGTALALDRPALPVLPFVEGEAPPEIFAASEEPKPRPASRLAGTALAVDGPRGPALPFEGHVDATAPAVVPAAMGKPALAGTALAVDVPTGPHLPFVDDEAPPEISLPSEEPKPAARPSGTALAVDVPCGPALPFAPDATPKPPARPAVPAPVMTIEQYASLCVELEGGAEAAVLARYRLSPEERAALEEAFGKRFERWSAQRRAWETACETYRAWLAANGRGGG